MSNSAVARCRPSVVCSRDDDSPGGGPSLPLQARQQAIMTEGRGMRSSDRIAHETILTFDVAGNEIWGTLRANATLVIVDDTTRLLGFEAFLSK